MTAAQRSYLVSIYRLSRLQEKVLSVDVAAHLDVSRASVSKTMKALCEKGYVHPQYQSHVQLTPYGERVAHSILEEELIIIRFFQETLALSPQTAESYASSLAPLLDADTLSRMAHLGEDPQSA